MITTSSIPPKAIPSGKEITNSSIKKSLAAPVSKSDMDADKVPNNDQVGLEEAGANRVQHSFRRVSVATYLMFVGATITPVGAFLLLVLSAIGFSSWHLLLYSYGIAIGIEVVWILIYAIIGFLIPRA